MKKLVPLSVVVALAVTCGRSGVYRFDDDGLMSLPDGAVVMGEDAGEVDAGFIPCTPGRIQLVRATPTALLVLDRSSSMGFRFENSTRWRALTAALKVALPKVDQTMEIGALTYPLGSGVLSCTSGAALDVVPAKNSSASIIRRMESLTPNGSTPTASALDIAGPAILSARAPIQGRALIMATDGAPGCNAALDPRTCTCINNMGTGGTGNCEPNRCLDDKRTVARIAHFADAGLPTYVIGLQSASDTTLVKALNDMAIAGGRPRADATTKYYEVGSQAELDTALTQIRDSVGACSFFARSVPTKDEAMTVTLPGGAVVPFDPTGTSSGWAWGNKRVGELYFVGPACDEITARMHMVLEADVACEDP
ncbi:MAG: VWA domain-containing protein [Myxococcaceae bacterium]|nr:VWA domain-containing protein [Myxococcaceae bacterium]